ncbi:MAG: hypothetical protein CMJ65_18195 [Planctomycetaceae bacterium]|jgi:hypothetical protein|nr:hypothetical protein [Planctomycetaceae bacterium]
MGWELLNTPMLWGLAGLSLPVLTHLLSRKRHEVVPWAAMQFLELEKTARRKVRFEELLLIVLRMALVALLVVALCRPASSGGWLASLLKKTRRDVVLVIDGSYSMGWRDGRQTPHAAAIQWAHRYLEELGPGDRVAVLEARDQVRGVIDPPTVNHDVARASLSRLAPPAGTADLPAAIHHAIGLLRETSNLRREIIILTDGQAIGWRSDDPVAWETLDDQLDGFPDATRPRILVATPGEPRDTAVAHYHLDQLELSRELVPSGLAVTLRTTIHGHGNAETATRRVVLEVDGQRLSNRALSVRVPPSGKTTVEFEHRLQAPGSHRLAVVLDEDPLPGDDRSEAAVVSVEALPVLLVDGAPHPDVIRSETFFAHAALSATANERPWIDGRVVTWDRLKPTDLESAQVVVLANLTRPEPEHRASLIEFVSNGGGLLITLGDRTNAAAWNTWSDDSGILPARILDQGGDPLDPEDSTAAAVHPADESLNRSWLTRFRGERQGGFTEARFTRWWSLAPGESPEPAQVAARLTSGDPLLVTGRLQQGRTAIWASSLDADWNTLPARPDYVSFLHELLFRLAGGQSTRNITTGDPLLMTVPADFDISEHVFIGPTGQRFAVERGDNRQGQQVRLADTGFPGHYSMIPRRSKGRSGQSPEHFVVNSDRNESSLQRLDETTRGRLAGSDRLRFVADQQDLREAINRGAPHTELWHLVLVLFLGLLLAEVTLTRRMVRGGYQQETGDS